MLFLPSFDPETSHNLAIHLASIWRDTQIGLISAFFVPTQETQNWGYLTCCCCETKSWGQFYFYAFCNLFSFSFFRPWKVMKIYSLPLCSCIFSPFYFGLKPISNAWVIIYFELSSFLYRAWITLDQKLQVVYFLTMMVSFVLYRKAIFRQNGFSFV